MSRFKSLVLAPLLLIAFYPWQARAVSASLVISELQTASATNAGQEFVELYNPTAQDVSVEGWVLQYKSATSAVAEASWTKRADLKGVVKANGFYLISQKSYLASADADLSTAGLSGSGGHIRIKDKSGTVIDLLGWGSTANAAEAMPAAAPPAGQSLERLPGRLIEDGGNATDTDDNSKDFVLRAAPLPQASVSPVEMPSSNVPAIDEPVIDDQTAPAAVTYYPLMITELMPDPGAPLSDAKDEYVEIYNPNPVIVDLKGYTIRAGSNFHSFYNLPSGQVAPGAYLAVYSRDSHVGLTNAGGAAQLLDPTGTVVSQTDAYSSAPTGQSWSLFDGTWKWSLQTTPGADNVLVVPLLNVAAITPPKVKTASTSAKTASSTTAPKSSTKTTKTTTPKSTKAKSSSQTAVAAQTTPHSAAWLLIVLAVASIGYAIYEFRHDVRNYYHLARRYFKTRRSDRPAA